MVRVLFYGYNSLDMDAKSKALLPNLVCLFSRQARLLRSASAPMHIPRPVLDAVMPISGLFELSSADQQKMCKNAARAHAELLEADRVASLLQGSVTTTL